MKKLAVLAAVLWSGLANANPCFVEGFAPQIPPPPPQSYLDVQRLHLMAELRTPARVQAIKDQADDFTPQFWAVAGVDARNYPAVASQVGAMQQAVGVYVMDLKAKINRTRANEVDPQLSTVVPVPWHKAYPSGHATQAFMTALVMSEAMPEKADEFMRLAADIALNREVAGLHYATDSEAGYMIAQQAWAAATPLCKPLRGLIKTKSGAAL